MDSIDLVLKKLEKDFGENIVIKADIVEEINFNKTGSINLDMALGGGFPAGKIIEIFGVEMSGKTTIALIHAAEYLKEHPDHYGVFIDIERTLDPNLLEAYGIDTGRFIIAYPDTAEQTFDMMERLASLENCKIIILDSIAALSPEYEVVNEMEKQSIGLAARVIGKGLRKLIPVAYRNQCELIFINQLRATMAMYGSPETTPGGRALRFNASQRLDVRKGEPITDPLTKDTIGHEVRIRVVKNKVAVPFKTCSFNLIYGVGIERESELIDILLLTGKIQRGGAWMKIVDKEGKPIVRKLPEDIVYGDKDEVVLNFQGKDNFTNYLKLDRPLNDLLEKMCYGEEVTEEELANTVE